MRKMSPVAVDAGNQVHSEEDSASDNFLVEEYLQTVPHYIARGLVYVFMLLFLSSLIFVSAVKIDVVVQGQAVALPETDNMRILSDREGYLTQVFITVGQKVEKESPLFQIRSQETIPQSAKAEELKNVIPLREQYFDTKISIAQEQRNYCDVEFRTQMETADLKLKQNQLTLNSLDSDMEFRKLEIERWTRQEQFLKKMLERGVVSQYDYSEGESHLRTTQLEFQKSKTEKEKAQRDKEMIEKEIREIQSNHEKEITIRDKEIENLQKEKETELQSLRSELQRNEFSLSVQNQYAGPISEGTGSGYLIRSRCAGTVLELSFKNSGEYIKRSDLLCTLVPSDIPLFMDITVANADIGIIQEGMKIRYKFNAFPYMDYGTLYGQVQAIAPSAIPDNRSEYVYHIRGSVKPLFFTTRQNQYPVRAGMTAVAELVTERRSILSYLLFRK